MSYTHIYLQIAKVTKEKKGMDDGNKKLMDDLQSEEDKCNHLNKLKQKLEHQIDELEDNLQREKKVHKVAEHLPRLTLFYDSAMRVTCRFGVFFCSRLK